jgi:ketosteroid isomerase-like protein
MRTAYDIVKAHYDASARGDLDGMLADLAPDAEWIEMEGSLCAGTHVGPAAVVENVFKVIGRAFEEFEFRLDRLLDAGRDVVAIGGYHGRHRRSGRPFSVRTAHLWTVRDGKVRRFEQFTDTKLLDDGAP